MNKKNKKFIDMLARGFTFTPIIIILLFSSMFLFNKKDYIDYPTFLKQVEEKNVNEIVLKDEEIIVKYKDGKNTYTSNPNSPSFREEMLKEGIKVSTSKTPIYISVILKILMYIFIMVIVYLIVNRILDSFKNNFGKEKESYKVINKKFNPITNSNTTFSDVAGIDEAKDSLMEIVHYVKNPKKLVEMGIKPPSGILLVGDPGNGKTLLAKAIAGEAKVPFFSISGSDFVEKYVGVGAARVRELFSEARKVAPSIIFIDEIDAVGKKRDSSGNGSNDERDQTLNQLLVEMDGLSNSDGIIIVAATNRVDMLDSALKRAGRFDKHIEVDYPDLKGREMILKVHSKNKNLDETVDLLSVARNTVGLSGADLENVLNQSGYIALRKKKNAISFEDILEAIDEVTIGIKKKRCIMTKKEKECTAYHEVGHALATYFLANKTIEKITILPVSRALGYVKPTYIDTVSITKQEYLNEICINMAGKAAEELIYGKNQVSSGPSQDLKNATQRAYKMVFEYGMSKIGTISLDVQLLDKVSDNIKNDAFKEVQNILEECYDKTYNFLKENKELLEKVTREVLRKEVLNRNEFNSFLIDKCKVNLPKEVFEFMKRTELQDNFAEEINADFEEDLELVLNN